MNIFALKHTPQEIAIIKKKILYIRIAYSHSEKGKNEK